MEFEFPNILQRLFSADKAKVKLSYFVSDILTIFDIDGAMSKLVADKSFRAVNYTIKSDSFMCIWIAWVLIYICSCVITLQTLNYKLLFFQNTFIYEKLKVILFFYSLRKPYCWVKSIHSIKFFNILIFIFCRWNAF